MKVVKNASKPDRKQEYLHVCNYSSELYSHWNIHDWRYKFAHMFNQKELQFLTIRVIGWQENAQNMMVNAKYTDIIVNKEVQDQFLPILSHFHVCIVEIGLGDGDNFFPIMQSKKLYLYDAKEDDRSFLLHQCKWNSCYLDQKKSYSQFSTYTYYENLGGE
ncbi:DUF4912 domain-containing protein [Sutcliffiella halmapala]|uniref:DUF4912 domain-containing protein n=1 Tax=Sutcliffiella halmapala TaxID=79882 RepID=UPI001472F1D8|nr:DUF4912 domain-containing protein [Sutcliffiella halmapala]